MKVVDPRDADPRRALKAFTARQSPGVGRELASAVDVFAAELANYAELIVGPGGKPVGFMTRGEGEDFTKRAQLVLRGLDVPAAAVEHHRFLAEAFDHTRGFFKVEWHAGPDGRVTPLAACYFRRRPAIERVLAALHPRGLSTPLQDELRQIAAILDKRTVHFVAAAFRPGHAVHHKLYFSQWVTDETKPVVEARIERLFDCLGGRPELRELWRRLHRQTFQRTVSSTMFVSVNLTNDERLPWFKLDLPEVTPALAADWAPPERRAAVRAEAGLACAAVGTPHLAFLGVRLERDASHPQLKYYADFGTTEPYRDAAR